MDENIAETLLIELFPALESAESESAALLQFLKDKGIVTDEEFAPYLERASNAANVRAVAARVRMNSLLSSAIHTAGELVTKKIEKALRDRETEKGGTSEAAPHEKRGERESAVSGKEEERQEKADGTSGEREPQKQVKEEAAPQPSQKQSRKNESEKVTKNEDVTRDEDVTKKGESATADSPKKSTEGKDDKADKKDSKAA